MERYARIREPRAFAGSPRRVCVLSRVTLGADIAVSSAVIDAAETKISGSRDLFCGTGEECGAVCGRRARTALVAPYSRSGLLRIAWKRRYSFASS